MVLSMSLSTKTEINPFKAIFICAIIIAAFFSIELGNRRLATPDEGRYVEISREMAESEDFVTPRLNGVKYFEKPPLFYWMESAAFKVFGNKPSFAQMRAVEVGLAVLGGILLMLAGYYAYGLQTALISGGVLSTTLLYYIQSRFISLDLSFSVFMSGALWCYFLSIVKGCVPNKRAVLILAYVFAAFAVLAKGLAGIVLPGLVVCTWLLFDQKSVKEKWQIFKESFCLPGIILFLLLTLPWHIICAMRNEDFAYFYLIYEHFVRYATKSHCRYQPFWFFCPILFAALLPWTGICFASLVKAWKSKNSENIYLLSWIGSIFVFFSFSSSKLIPYILPIFPPFALLTGKLLSKYIDSPILSRFGKVGIGFYCSMAIVAIAAVGGFLYRHLIAGALNEDSINLLLALLAVFVILLTLWEVFTYFIQKGKLSKISHVLLLIIASANVMFLVNRIATYYQDDRKPSTKDIADIIKYNLDKDVEVFCYNTYFQDLPVYLNRTVGVIDYIGELEFGVTHEDHSDRFMDSEKFLDKFKNANNRIFVCIKREDYNKFFSYFNCSYKILEVNKYFVLVVNK